MFVFAEKLLPGGVWIGVMAASGVWLLVQSGLLKLRAYGRPGSEAAGSRGEYAPAGA